eukprot:m.233480 g.233480  ORF g.233480 m.233480 type:complete len:137 (+) comp26505_c0_seq25:1255-1665(+)
MFSFHVLSPSVFCCSPHLYTLLFFIAVFLQDYFPWQLYVREARRMRGLFTLTGEHMQPVPNNVRSPLNNHAIAVGEFPTDSFPCSPRMPDPAQRRVGAALEGYIDMDKEVMNPYSLPVEMMLNSQVSNLIVSGAVR